MASLMSRDKCHWLSVSPTIRSKNGLLCFISELKFNLFWLCAYHIVKDFPTVFYNRILISAFAYTYSLGHFVDHSNMHWSLFECRHGLQLRVYPLLCKRNVYTCSNQQCKFTCKSRKLCCIIGVVDSNYSEYITKQLFYSHIFII